MAIVRYALIDLSGTLHVGDTPIPGAVAAIHKLLQIKSLKILFLTNTTTVSAETLYERLVSNNMGFPADLQIMTSAGAVVQFAQKHDLHPYCIVEEDMKQDLSEIAAAQEEDENEDYDSVLIGLAPSKLNYQSLNKAFRILKKYPPSTTTTTTTTHPHETTTATPHRLLAFHRSNYLRDTDKLLSLGPGGFLSCLEETTGHSARVLGKPARDFYQAALSKLGAENNPEECIMIGDDYRNDIQGAYDAGIGNAILVKTGKYEPGDETKVIHGDGADDDDSFMVVPSIVEAVDFVFDRCEREKEL